LDREFLRALAKRHPILTSHGARLITTNRTDFELINKYREIRLEVW
jgi:hypothetical protein